MKKYNFRFEKILKLREYEEKKAQQELAQVIQIYKGKEKLLHDLLRKREKKLEDCMKIIREGTDGSYHKIYREYIEILKIKISQCVEEIKELKAEIVEKQEKLKELSSKKQALVRLKERKINEYLYEINKKEQAQIDELFLLKEGNLT